MTSLGTIRYEIKQAGSAYVVESVVWNKGMFGREQWFRNYVAELPSMKEAEELVRKLENM